MGLNPKKKSVALERGSWIHSLLEAHYDGEDWVAVHKQLSKDFYNLFEEQREDLGDLPTECRRIFRSYLRYWRDVDDNFVVVDTELDEIVTLPNGLEVQIIVDLIMEDKRTGLLWPWDHKTRKSFESSDNMLMDPQLTIYFDGLSILGYKNLGGVTYNELRTKAPAVPEPLARGGLTKRKNIDTDVFTYMSAIRAHDLDPGDYRDILAHLALNQHERFFRRVSLPKDPPMVKQMRREVVQTAQQIMADEKRNRFPRTFIPNSCKWDCDYKNLCIAQLHGADIEPMVKMDFERRDRGGRKPKSRNR